MEANIARSVGKMQSAVAEITDERVRGVVKIPAGGFCGEDPLEGVALFLGGVGHY